MKVSNVNVYGLAESIRGAKFPMAADLTKINENLTPGIEALAMSASGEGHDQWLTGVTVQFDLTCTNKMWVEAERYRFLYFVSSQSTMHRITRFDICNQCNEYVWPQTISELECAVNRYNLFEDKNSKEAKELYLEILYNVPAGFELTARMTTNYRELKTIYKQRKDHRLPEWREFCKWIETLPYSHLITGNKDGVNNGCK